MWPRDEQEEAACPRARRAARGRYRRSGRSLDGGYLIPESGLINPRDASGQIVRPPFNVPKKLSFAEVAVRLEEQWST